MIVVSCSILIFISLKSNSDSKFLINTQINFEIWSIYWWKHLTGNSLITSFSESTWQLFNWFETVISSFQCWNREQKGGEIIWIIWLLPRMGRRGPLQIRPPPRRGSTVHPRTWFGSVNHPAGRTLAGTKLCPLKARED